MIEINGKEYRNLIEQVEFLSNKMYALIKQLPYNGPYATLDDIPDDVKVDNGTDAAKILLANERLDASVLQNSDSIFTKGKQAFARILNEREEEPEALKFGGAELGELVTLIDKGTISSAIAKKVLEELFENPKMPSKIIEEKGWVQISDEGAIKEVVMKVLENNPQSIADYKAGKDKALGFLVGQAMKETRGKANPQMLNKMFLDELNK